MTGSARARSCDLVLLGLLEVSVLPLVEVGDELAEGMRERRFAAEPVRSPGGGHLVRELLRRGVEAESLVDPEAEAEDLAGAPECVRERAVAGVLLAPRRHALERPQPEDLARRVHGRENIGAHRWACRRKYSRSHPGETRPWSPSALIAFQMTRPVPTFRRTSARAARMSC